jgi:hypothetical protein
VDWLIGGLLCILGYLALELIGQAVGELLLPLFSPLRTLYRPPHGGIVLSLTWGAALLGTVLGFRAVESRVGVIVFVLSIPAALVASAVYRDEQQEEQRYGSLPPRHSGS